MKQRIVGLAVAAASTLLLTTVAAVPAGAARCVSGADVRGQVAEFVHGIRDDVTSKDARQAVRTALVESVRAARGVKADTPKEIRGLGEQISALAMQLKDAPGRVERAALVAAIHALQEQKRAGHVTPDDVDEIRADINKVKHTIVAKTDHPAEGRAVADWVHVFMAQFNC